MSTRRPPTPSGRRAPVAASARTAPAKPAPKKLEVVVIPAPGVTATPKANPAKPSANRPVPAKSAGNKPVATKPDAKKSSAKKSAAKKTVPSKPPANKPAAKSPAAKKPPVNKPKSGPTPRVPNRVSIHEVAPEQVRKKLDNLEATAHANAAPEALTARTLIGAVIVLLVAALLIPTLRGAVEQSQHIAAQKAQLEASIARSEQLDYELARWDDPVFIEAQARSRLSYVRPGDKVWRPVGGEILAEDVDPLTGIRVDEGVVGATAGQPWFDALLESFIVANGPLEPQPDDLNEILNRNRNN